MKRALVFIMIFELLCCIVNSQEHNEEDFWEKYRFSLRIVHIRQRNYHKIINEIRKESTRKIIASEQLFKISNLSGFFVEEGEVYALNPNKSVYQKLVLESSTFLDENELEKVNKDFFILRTANSFDEHGEEFIPYYCFVSIGDKIKIVDRDNYIDNPWNNKKYKKLYNDLNVFLEDRRKYKFRSEKSGIIWAVLLENGS